jgi:cold shock CspA family protein
VSRPLQGAGRKPAPITRQIATAAAGRDGIAATGRIIRLMIGQSHGFIRLTDRREVFFHRSDLREGTSFNKLAVGDVVTFDLVEDRISGARALRVALR